MSQAFSTPEGEAVGPAIMLFVIFLGLITGVIIYHAVAYCTRPMDRAPGITISQPEEHDRAGVLSTEIRTTQTMTIHLGR